MTDAHEADGDDWVLCNLDTKDLVLTLDSVILKFATKKDADDFRTRYDLLHQFTSVQVRTLTTQ